MAVLSVLFGALLLFFLFYGVKMALAASPYIQKLMSFVWQDPMVRYRAQAVKRIKELCVDGDVPDETAILMAAKELDMTEEQLVEALNGLTPQVMKAMSKGDLVSALLKANDKLMRNIKHGGG